MKDLTPEQYLQKLSTADPNSNCPIRRTLELFNGKWRTHIIFELCKSPTLRFGQLKKAIPGITSTMLTSALRELEDMGIVHREQFNEIPPHVEYSLSESGKALIPIFFEISKWSNVYLQE